jgi:hypothetical protein
MGDLLLILAVLASAAAILQVVARQGVLGPTMHGWAAQYSREAELVGATTIESETPTDN